jgi:photosystem II stability/assembly factor-like uncharacterized protein
MKSKFPLLLFVLLLLFILSACGTLQITFVTPVIITHPQDTPGADTFVQENSSESASTPPVPSPVESPTPTLPEPTLLPTAYLMARLQPGEALTILSIRMMDANNGWAIGRGVSTFDRVLVTLDGGRTWRDVTPAPVLTQVSPSPSVSAVFFKDGEHAWIVYGSQDPWPSGAPIVVWATSDAGQTWVSSQPLALNDLSLETVIPADLGFTDLSHGWMMVHMGNDPNHDYVSIFTTADAGKTWQRVVDPSRGNLDMACNKTGLVFTTPERGWLTINCKGVQPGVFFYTSDDGGRSWTLEDLPAQAGDLKAYMTPADSCGTAMPTFSNPNVGWVMVSCYSPGTRITRSWLFLTGNAGLSWSPRPAPIAYGTFQFIDTVTGWWLGTSAQEGFQANGLYTTTNSGNTWSQVISTGWTGQLDFIDAQTGWVVARAGDQVALVFTRNGGRFWEEIKPAVRQ